MARLSEVAAFIQHGYATRQCVAALFSHTFWCSDLTACRTGGETLAMPAARAVCASDQNGHASAPRCTGWHRFEVLACLLEVLTNEFLFVTLGDPCKEVYALQDRAETFICWAQ
jgi:hypothetical protein